MNYSDHISDLLKSHSTLNLSGEALGTLMNLVYLEGAISSLKKIKEKNKFIQTRNKYDVWIKNYSDKLDKITQKLAPTDLINIIAKVGL